MITPTRRLALGLLAVLALTRPAGAEPVMCKRTIVKEASKYLQTVMKTLQRCEDKRVGGSLPPPTVCTAEPRTAATLARAEARLRGKVAQRCGGGDRTCGTPDDDPLSAIGWNIGACPNFESGACTNPIASCADIGTCLECVGDAAVR